MPKGVGRPYTSTQKRVKKLTGVSNKAQSIWGQTARTKGYNSKIRITTQKKNGKVVKKVNVGGKRSYTKVTR
jgi:hypothetical protein